MTLKDYLDRNGLSLKAFGERCGLSAPTILRARDGVNIPSRRTLQAIVSATDGAVHVVLDLYSRRVIGWAVSNRMKRDPLAGDALASPRGGQSGR